MDNSAVQWSKYSPVRVSAGAGLAEVAAGLRGG